MTQYELKILYSCNDKTNKFFKVSRHLHKDDFTLSLSKRCLYIILLQTLETTDHHTRIISLTIAIMPK